MAEEDRAGFSSKTNTIKLIMELEIKHLSPYLPYDLQCIGYGRKLRLNGQMLGAVDRLIVKPILRPLSDLTEEYSNACNYSHKDFKWEIINKNISVLVWDSLLKNHFDVFGLIDAGLAIDINTI